MKSSTEIAALAKALAKAQLEMKSADKSSVNPHFKSKYAALPEVMEVAKALNRNGIAVLQPTSSTPDSVTVETVLVHGESGQWMSGELTLVPQQKTPQGVGSAVTYGRRFSLCSLAGIVADEDDDGNAASVHAPTKSNGKKPEQTQVVDPIEQKAAALIEKCEAGFATAEEKLEWKAKHREEINHMPQAFKGAVVKAFEDAVIRS